jgi:WD40 repeat protein
MDIIASGSNDQTIRIWNINAFKEIQTLKEDFEVWSLLKLKNKNEMVAGGTGNNNVSFWNTITFTKEHTVECCECLSLNGLIELPNGYVAVSGGTSSTIDVIDTETYQRIKHIQCEGYISGDVWSFSSLRLLSNGTFVYSRKGCFCQISSTTYEVLFKDKKEKEFRGEAITSPSNGKYIIANNNNDGISIFKMNFI